MNLRDIEAQAKALAPILRDYVSKAIDAVSVSVGERMAALEKAVNDKIEAIPAPKDGEPGRDGEPGKDADPISLETVEKMVAEAVEKAIAALPVAKDGIDGRDALQIEIKPRIDESKMYERGTFARHKGGLWRAYECTDGMRGWECIVDGIDFVDVDCIGGRTFSVAANLSSAKAIEKAFSIPTMIYRNVWKEGTYQKGDVVTFGGCVWHCDEDTDTKPGDGAKHWTLAVKKGRDGKSA